MNIFSLPLCSLGDIHLQLPITTETAPLFRVSHFLPNLSRCFRQVFLYMNLPLNRNCCLGYLIDYGFVC